VEQVHLVQTKTRPLVVHGVDSLSNRYGIAFNRRKCNHRYICLVENGRRKEILHSQASDRLWHKLGIISTHRVMFVAFDTSCRIASFARFWLRVRSLYHCIGKRGRFCRLVSRRTVAFHDVCEGESRATVVENQGPGWNARGRICSALPSARFFIRLDWLVSWPSRQASPCRVC
jgi:hypothetical protein